MVASIVDRARRRAPGGQKARDRIGRVDELVLASRPYDSSSIGVHSLAARGIWMARQGRLGRVPLRATHHMEVQRSPAIPRMAWLAEVVNGRHLLTVGPDVERLPAGVFEGVWDGPFDRFEPDRTEFAFGSGAVARNGRVRFVAPRHTQEFLYVLRDRWRRSALVSNSLAFALEAGGVEVGSPAFEAVATRLRDVTDRQNRAGLDWARPLVTAAGGLELYQMAYHPFEIDAAGRPRSVWSPPEQHFVSFAEYRSFLLEVTARLIANAVDDARARPLPPVATISKGYDSVATAAVASQLGCREALTLAVTVEGRSDSGSDVAAHLGMDVIVRKHVAGDALEGLDFIFDDALASQAAEFLATSGIGDDVAFAAFEADLEGRLLFTGKYGDSVWPRDSNLRSGMPVLISFGKSISEFRLRVGFAHVPTPGLGSRFAPPIRRLSIDAEMGPWSIGGMYDRPLARRLAEEAGVPRALFGQQKTATSPLPLNRAEMFAGAMSSVMGRYQKWRTACAPV